MFESTHAQSNQLHLNLICITLIQILPARILYGDYNSYSVYMALNLVRKNNSKCLPLVCFRKVESFLKYFSLER